MRFLAQILTEITRKPRSKVVAGVDFEWSSKLWIHNIFRVYELLFWRRSGPRAESTLDFANGKYVQTAHTWEASCALFETMIRESFSYRYPVRVWIPVLWTTQGIPVFASPYLFAIGLDTTSDTTNNPSPVTQSFTCTGSNLLLVAGGVHNSATPTGVLYSTDAMSQINSTILVGSGYYLSAWGLIAPATGANNITATLSGTDSYVRAVSYSGVLQSGFPDSNNGGSGTNNTLTASTTVVASNCWQTTWAYNQAGEAFVAGAGIGAIRGGAATNQKFGDSNTTVGTGSQSQTMTWTTSNPFAWINFSFAPSGGAAATTITRLSTLLGVGQ